MIRKLRKMRRYWAARLRPASLPPLFWHIGAPNFGDDINPAFFHALSGQRLRLATRRDTPHFLGMGSILDRATAQSVVLGAGLISPDALPPPPGRIIALRGHLTRQALGLADDLPLGDPMVLVDRLLRADPDGSTGFIPHVTQLAQAQSLLPAGMRLIDVTVDPWQVVRQIAACRRILSQSLHGVIVADALGIPNLWIAPDPAMKGGRFKFDDYFSTMDAPKIAHPLTRDLLQSPPAAEFAVATYRGDKAAYHAILRATLTEGLR
ncbi:MAG: hypothetical protein RIT14_348 [Pseudomonadota bacterium]